MDKVTCLSVGPSDFADCWEGPENDADRRFSIVVAPFPTTTIEELLTAEVACKPFESFDTYTYAAGEEAAKISSLNPTVRIDVWQFYLSTYGEQDTGAANEIDHTLIESYVAGEEVDCEEGDTK